MNVRVKELERRILDLLNENSTLLAERLEYCDPFGDISSLIRDLLPDMARLSLLEMPLPQIDECRHLADLRGVTLSKIPALDPGPVTLLTPPGYVRRDGSGNAASYAWLALPSDFLRLLHFRMEGWAHGVTAALAYGGEAHQLRRAGVGGRSAPAVAIRDCGDVKVLEIYGADSGAEVSEISYLTAPAVTGATIDLPPAAIPDVCRRTADALRAILNVEF